MGTTAAQVSDAPTSTLAQRPDHVPADRVIDFNLHQPIPGGQSIHEYWRALLAEAKHDLMWTPHNGGHWLATEPGLCETILSDWERFSTRVVIVPREPIGETYSSFIPLSLDPPVHGRFRKVLNDNLGPRHINLIAGNIRSLTNKLIDSFLAKGRCDFMEDFAQQLPVRIFMALVDLPDEDLPRLKYLADQFTRPDGTMEYPDVEKAFRDYVGPVLRERRGGSGTDMITSFANAEVDGRPMTDAEAQNLTIQALIAGLDTVINLLSFVFSYLAITPQLQQHLAKDSSNIDAAMNEFLRRFPVVSISREVRNDIEVDGVTLKQRDMIMASTIPIAMSEQGNQDALEFRMDRQVRRHSVFGRGIHTCPGMYLGKLELKIVLTEWFKRIPVFRLANGTSLSYTSGVVATVDPFSLEWDV